MFNVSPSNNTRTGWSFRQSMAQGCALLELEEVEVRTDANNKPFEEPRRTVVRV